eukprot:TRINITY_DN234_c0_g2_i1.p1 TRINITY_DN234_c0_g2~~TRINITY_DN234_c0_g2_i1.p1  ORF type:complete len:424 (+),score=102.97 TRINITY_DN234_c0_g2_i1:44-1273(+)
MSPQRLSLAMPSLAAAILAATVFLVAPVAALQQQLTEQFAPSADAIAEDAAAASARANAAATAANLEVARRWLQSGKDPSFLPELRFVSLNTEGELSVKEVGEFPEKVENVGLNTSWVGYGTKLLNVMYYTKSVPDDAIVVYFDGNDVVWGGCSRSQFLESYWDIVRSSGANLVVGAELVCGEQNCDDSSEIPTWARARAGQMLLASTLHEQIDECGSQVKAECRCDVPSPPECRAFNYTSADDWGQEGWQWAEERLVMLSTISKLPQQSKIFAAAPFRFLNSGFVMGPAKDIRDMFQWAAFHYLSVKEKREWVHDQGAIAEYWRRNPSKIALDYRGELSVSLPRLHPSVLELGISDVSGSAVMRNKLLGGRLQCLIHNNINEWNGGLRAGYWWEKMLQLATSQRDWYA